MSHRRWSSSLALMAPLLLALPFFSPSARAALADDQPAACTARAGPKDNLQGVINALPADGSHAVLCLAAGDYQLQGLLWGARGRGSAGRKRNRHHN